MGKAHGVRHARKHLAAYADEAIVSGAAPDAEARRLLLTTDDPSQALAAMASLFSPACGRAAA
ncbi:hypothetical protein ABIE41_003324 [Bosea sp. OAE506]